jgi:hypothetical protein
MVLFLYKTPSCPEIGTSSIVWATLSRLHLKMERQSSLRNVVLSKNRTMDIVQKKNSFLTMVFNRITEILGSVHRPVF